MIFVSRDEYNEIAEPDPNTLYAIRKDNRCVVVALNDKFDFDALAPSIVLYFSSFWDALPTWMKGGGEAHLGRYEYQEMFIGRKFDVSTIEENFFEDTNLYRATIDLPSYTIQAGAFLNCSKLTEIKLGSGVTSIASNAFEGCDNLETIYINLQEDSISGAPWGAENAEVVWQGDAPIGVVEETAILRQAGYGRSSDWAHMQYLPLETNRLCTLDYIPFGHPTSFTVTATTTSGKTLNVSLGEYGLGRFVLLNRDWYDSGTTFELEQDYVTLGIFIRNSDDSDIYLDDVTVTVSYQP